MSTAQFCSSLRVQPAQCSGRGAQSRCRQVCRPFRRVLAHARAQPSAPELIQVAPPFSHVVTGGRLGSEGSSRSLVPPEKLPLSSDKQVVLVRHGMSNWNVEGRIQGSSDEPELTEFGVEQVRAAGPAL